MKKKALSMTLAVVLSLSMGMTAFAAPITMSDGNTFDPDYYAQNNTDVVQALGTDSNALYSHYVNFGKTEGRLPYASGSSTIAIQTATQGTAAAYLETGRNALYGLNGTAISLETAYNNFLTAKQLGSVEANFYLGILCDWYSYPSKDYAKAKAYYEACGDNPNAQISLAFLYNNGQGVAKDEAKALSMLQTLVNKGYVDAYYGLGEIAYSNDDYAKALNYLTKFASEGSEPLYLASAMNELGYIYQHGYSVSRDGAKAVEWYTKSANLGNEYAMYNLGYIYMYGDGVAQDYAKAMEWYIKSANLGYSRAMNSIGYMYKNGQGVAQDYTKAMEWYMKAVNLGESGAMYNLGYMFAHGQGVAQDYTKAMEWYTKAANLGETVAMNSIGYMYENGQGVAQDYTKAMEWYMKAVNLGESSAMYNIGCMYENGQGVAQDYAKAMEWYMKSVNLGDATAMNNIGTMYWNGTGVEKDVTKAVEWWQKAAALGEETAVENLREAGY
jgi:hypothetical protein